MKMSGSRYKRNRGRPGRKRLERLCGGAGKQKSSDRDKSDGEEPEGVKETETAIARSLVTPKGRNLRKINR